MQTLPTQATQSFELHLVGELNSKQRQTLEKIYINPVKANIPWIDIEILLVALGAVVRQGKGSRVRVALNGVKAVFHEPHPQKEVCKGAVRSVRDFLENAGVVPLSKM